MSPSFCKVFFVSFVDSIISDVCKYVFISDLYSNTTMLLMEQELNNLPEHLCSSPLFSGVHAAQSCVLGAMFCRFLFDLCVLAIVLSILLRFMFSGHAFGIWTGKCIPCINIWWMYKYMLNSTILFSRKRYMNIKNQNFVLFLFSIILHIYTKKRRYQRGNERPWIKQYND